MQRGFTLLELTVVIGIIALLIGSGLAVQIKATEKRSVEITHQRMQKILQTIDDFVDHHGYIPCPANPTATSTDDVALEVTFNAFYGVAGSNGVSICDKLNIIRRTVGGNVFAIGTVPFHTLALPPEFGVDGWGSRFTYSVFEPATFRGDGTTPQNGSTGYTGQPQRGSNAMSLTINGTGGTSIDDVFVTVLSHGPDKLGAWHGLGGGVNGTTGIGTLDEDNSDHSHASVYPRRVTTANEDGDDILYYLTKWYIDAEWKN